MSVDTFPMRLYGYVTHFGDGNCQWRPLGARGLHVRRIRRACVVRPSGQDLPGASADTHQPSGPVQPSARLRHFRNHPAAPSSQNPALGTAQGVYREDGFDIPTEWSDDSDARQVVDTKSNALHECESSVSCRKDFA